MNYSIDKGKLFEAAMQLNDYYQNPDEEKKELFERCNRDFCIVVNSIIKVPFDDLVDPYLNFTANREMYSLEEAILIERNLIQELRPKLLKLKYSFQN